MDEAFKLEISQRLVRVETQLEMIMKKLDGINGNQFKGGFASGGVGAAIVTLAVAILRVIGWL